MASTEERLYLIATCHTEVPLKDLIWRQAPMSFIASNYFNQTVRLLKCKDGSYLVKMYLRRTKEGWFFIRFPMEMKYQMLDFIALFDHTVRNIPKTQGRDVQYDIGESVDDAMFEAFVACGISISPTTVDFMRIVRQGQKIKPVPLSQIVATESDASRVPKSSSNPFSILGETSA